VNFYQYKLNGYLYFYLYRHKYLVVLAKSASLSYQLLPFWWKGQRKH